MGFDISNASTPPAATRGIDNEDTLFAAAGNVDNIHDSSRPTGTSQQAGLRKLRKHAKTREDVSEAYKRVLTGELSVNKALLQTGLRKSPPKSIRIASPEKMAEDLLKKSDISCEFWESIIKTKNLLKNAECSRLKPN